MKYPNFDSRLRSTDVVLGLAEDIARTEQAVERGRADARSLALAHLCIAVHEGRAINPPTRHIISTQDKRGTGSMLSAVHDMVANANDKVRVARRQQQLHGQVIRSLQNSIHYYYETEGGAT